jgi:hypothetical protein
MRCPSAAATAADSTGDAAFGDGADATTTADASQPPLDAASNAAAATWHGLPTGEVILVHAKSVQLHFVAKVLLVQHMVDHPRLKQPPAQLLGRVSGAHLPLFKQQINHLVPEKRVLVSAEPVLTRLYQLVLALHHHPSDLEPAPLDPPRVLLRV